jgi:hypothetical protein
MSEKRSFVQFLIHVFAPIALILVGAGLAGLGITMGWTILLWAGLIVAAIGLIWGAILMLFHGPIDL